VTQAIVPPLLSVVIPTRNRQKYLLVLLEKLIESGRTDFEIVLQDNSDSDQLREAVLRIADPRIHYDYCAERLTIDVNCDLAVSLAKGYFCCMLGDDDGILVDESLSMLARARVDRVDAVLTATPYYAWPGVSHKVWGDVGGRIYLRDYDCHDEALDPVAERGKVLEHAGTLGLGRMPRLYHGFVTLDVLHALHATTGTFFPGPSPDMANAIGLTAYVKRFRYIDYPFIVSGHSASSGGGMGSTGTHRGDISAQSHLPKYTAATWSPQVPFFWSGSTIYGASILHAYGMLSKAPANFDFASLYAACFMYEGHSWRLTLKAMRTAHRVFPVLCARVLAKMLVIVARRARSLIINTFTFRWPNRDSMPAEDIGLAINVIRKKWPAQETTKFSEGQPT
jgi:hypothetical protein